MIFLFTVDSYSVDEWEEYKAETIRKRFDFHSENKLGRDCPAQVHENKFFDTETIKKMFQEETNLLQKLVDINVAKCCHYFRYKPRRIKPMHFFIVMEYSGNITIG